MWFREGCCAPSVSRLGPLVEISHNAHMGYPRRIVVLLTNKLRATLRDSYSADLYALKMIEH